MAGNKRTSTFGAGPLRAVAAIGGWLRSRFLGVREPPEALRPLTPRPYDVRKQQLPNLLTPTDWERCLEYWGHRCAICGRPRGLWHTLAQDHWIPLTHPDCPGTVATNILPLCHGEGGCNNSKGKKEPVAWLRARLGSRRARGKLQEIRAYFLWMREHEVRRFGCPRCGAPVAFYRETDLWVCTECSLEWDSATAQTMPNCPTCHCWMLESRRGYTCPRCQTEWTSETAPDLEWCPGCRRGVLHRVEHISADQRESWWRCPACGKEWVDDDPPT
jgi:DNA-directed RNA polymerase subunit RPC12/RpoP